MKVSFNATNEAVEKIYKDFSTKCITDSTNVASVKSSFCNVQKTYIKARQADTFCKKTEVLAENLKANGCKNIANMLTSELGKMYFRFGDFKNAEKMILKAINNSYKEKDDLHVLARMTDLEQIYKIQNNKQSLFNLLLDKKDCAKEILKDYPSAVKNFSSVIKPPTKLDAVKIQLAYTYSDLAELLLKSNPEASLKMLDKTKNIYIDLGKQKEVRYIEEKINRIYSYMK